MIDPNEFQKRLSQLRERIAATCAAAGRDPASVGVLPVTKNHPVEAVRYARRAGLSAVGENRVPEASDKRAAFGESDSVRWELIGHLQSNKAKQAVRVFDRIQSVDSLKLLKRLDRFAAEAGTMLPILLQFNTGEDPKKYGFPVDAADEAVDTALGLRHVTLDGLMTVAPLDGDPDSAARAFGCLRELRDRLEATSAARLPELSMGMTGDLEAAIRYGSTQIRVGTALYGSRGY